MKYCRANGCKNKPKAKQLCAKHYKRFRRTGGLNGRNYRERSRGIYGNVVIEKGTDCWVWQGTLDHRGYGVMHIPGRGISPQRYAFELRHGTVPRRHHVVRTCETRLCINPDHHVAITPNKKRQLISSRRRVIDDDTVIRIRADERNNQAIADELGVARSLISMIKSRQRYKSVKVSA